MHREEKDQRKEEEEEEEEEEDRQSKNAPRYRQEVAYGRWSLLTPCPVGGGDLDGWRRCHPVPKRL